MVQVGQKVRFDALYGCKQSIDKVTAYTVGTVVYINERHKWFSVKYGENQRTSFKFTEIGQNVHICK
jgi:hypothetical protein